VVATGTFDAGRYYIFGGYFQLERPLVYSFHCSQLKELSFDLDVHVTRKRGIVRLGSGRKQIVRYSR
jgi:hypothetical protein